jgi:hypothetical protein
VREGGTAASILATAFFLYIKECRYTDLLYAKLFMLSQVEALRNLSILYDIYGLYTYIMCLWCACVE